MSKIITLNKYVKFRMEKNKVLVCNCLTLVTLLFPLKTLTFFNDLRRGVIAGTFKNKYYFRIVSDLEQVGFLNNTNNNQTVGLWKQVNHYENKLIKN